jgi:ornithine cyclodeaminase
MRHYTDADLTGLISPIEAIDAMRDAFAALAAGRAAQQGRMRTETGGVKLSTMGAVAPSLGFAGAKVYSTIGGRFNFVVVLFDAIEGRALATFDAGYLTQCRTAAVSALAARYLARPESSVLTVLGTGVQGQGHVPMLAAALPIREVRVVSRGDAREFVETIGRTTGLKVKQMPTADALAGADVIVTATRTSTPLFTSAMIAPGAYIAAVGATLPTSAEVDVDTVARASCIAVEAMEQARHESGELGMAHAAGRLDWSRVVELSALVSGALPGRRSATDLTIFNSLGVGIEDVAIAGLAYRKLTA